MIRARKRFGQNFLEPAWVAKVIRAIDPQADDVFLEIGPGRGALTRPLAAQSARPTPTAVWAPKPVQTPAYPVASRRG